MLACTYSTYDERWDEGERRKTRDIAARNWKVNKGNQQKINKQFHELNSLFRSSTLTSKRSASTNSSSAASHKPKRWRLGKVGSSSFAEWPSCSSLPSTSRSCLSTITSGNLGPSSSRRLRCLWLSIWLLLLVHPIRTGWVPNFGKGT